MNSAVSQDISHHPLISFQPHSVLQGTQCLLCGQQSRNFRIAVKHVLARHVKLGLVSVQSGTAVLTLPFRLEGYKKFHYYCPFAGK